MCVFNRPVSSTESSTEHCDLRSSASSTTLHSWPRVERHWSNLGEWKWAWQWVGRRADEQSMPMCTEKGSLVSCQEGLTQQSQRGHFDGDLM